MWGGAAETLAVCAICITATSIRASGPPGRGAGQSQHPPPLVTLTGEARPRARDPLTHAPCRDVPRARSPVHLQSGVGFTLLKAITSLGEKMEFLHLP